MYEFVIMSTTHPPTIIIAATMFKAMHKAYADSDIVQENIYAIVRGRQQDTHTGQLSSPVKS